MKCMSIIDPYRAPYAGPVQLNTMDWEKAIGSLLTQGRIVSALAVSGFFLTLEKHKACRQL